MHHTRRRTAGFINPVTGRMVTPGKIIGYRKNGSPIRVIAGGSGEGEGAAGSGDGGSGSAGGDGSTGTGGDGQGDGTAGGAGPNIDGEFDADRAKRAIAAAREAEKKAKGDAKTARDQVAAILAAAGLKPDGSKDPAEQLKEASAKAEAAETTAREARVELAVYKRAGKAGGDPDALLDSRTFRDAVKDLDPAAADFGDKVTEAIKAAIKTNPKLAATTTQGSQGPARQGADHSGGGTGRQRPASLGAAVTARMNGQ